MKWDSERRSKQGSSSTICYRGVPMPAYSCSRRDRSPASGYAKCTAVSAGRASSSQIYIRLKTSISTLVKGHLLDQFRARRTRRGFAGIPWDLVVVDEVHHLLDAPHLYDLVAALSLKARDLLLLSAVPVRRRESELYRLLALLEPENLWGGPDRRGQHFLQSMRRKNHSGAD